MTLIRRFVLLAAVVCTLICPAATWAAALTTTTTLTIAPSSSITAGSAVTLTATVVDANSSAVTAGTVTFYDGAKALGAGQLVATGSASANLKRRLGSGTHSLTAVFQSTTVDASSTSAAQTLVVNASLPSATSISSAAGSSAGQYVLTGTVTVNGPVAPTGAISFLDQSNAGAAVVAADLSAGQGTHTFSTPSIPTVPGQSSVDYSVGDFNNDGVPDVALLDDASPAALIVTVLLGDGAGHLTPAPGAPLQVGSSYILASGDFNNDGNLDLATLTDSGSLYVYLGDGTGAFRAGPGLPLGLNGTDSPQNIAVADFNGDGNLDFFELANGCLSRPGAQIPKSNVLLGDGKGGFRLSASSPMAVTGSNCSGVGLRKLGTADFNGDGAPDVVVNDDVSSTLSVLLNDGAGNFVPPGLVTNNLDAYSIAIGDFNRDGYPDVAARGTGVAVYLNDTHGNLSAIQLPDFTSSGVTLTVGDFNGDGTEDLAVDGTANGSDGFSVLAGNGRGGFVVSSGTLADFGSSITVPYTLLSGDFNGDGVIDLSVIDSFGDATSGLYILLGQATQTATATTPSIAIPGAGSHTIVASYPGDSSYTASVSSATTLTGVSVAPADFAIAATPSSATIKRGQTATFTFTVTPVNGFNAPVNFSCGTLPAEATCSFSPASVTPGSGAATSTLTITTTAPAVSSNVPNLLQSSGKLGYGISVAALLLLCLPSKVRQGRTWHLLLLAGVVWTGVLAGCGDVKKLINDNTDPGTPTGNSAVTVTASAQSGSATPSHTAAITVIIQ